VTDEGLFGQSDDSLELPPPSQPFSGTPPLVVESLEKISETPAVVSSAVEIDSPIHVEDTPSMTSQVADPMLKEEETSDGGKKSFYASH
jgi:hypothetical protein